MTFKYTGPGYYVTRNGCKALVGETLLSGNPYDLTGVILDADGFVYRVSWFITGFSMAGKTPVFRDLVGPWVEPPKPLEAWAVVYPDNPSKFHCVFDTKRRAQDSIAPYRKQWPIVHMREVTEEK